MQGSLWGHGHGVGVYSSHWWRSIIYALYSPSSSGIVCELELVKEGIGGADGVYVVL